jgi:hypothetical protein
MDLGVAFAPAGRILDMDDPSEIRAGLTPRGSPFHDQRAFWPYPRRARWAWPIALIA